MKSSLLLLCVALLYAACTPSEPEERTRLIVYAAVDRETAEPLIRAFEKETGISIEVVFDSEAAKTVGLSQRVRLEKKNPNADVWWSGETLYTCLLEKDGCFEPLADYLDEKSLTELGPWRGDAWVGFGARLRVLVYDRDTWPSGLPKPTSLEAMTEPRLKGRCIMARPYVGTTATHAMWLASRKPGRELLRRIQANGVMLVGGNSHAVRAVEKGQALLALTDTDDALIAQDENESLVWVIPDQSGEGAVATPATAAVIRDCAHAESARRFVRWLASRPAEELLAATPSRNLPLRAGARGPKALPALSELKIASIEYRDLIENWDRHRRWLVELFGE